MNDDSAFWQRVVAAATRVELHMAALFMSAADSDHHYFNDDALEMTNYCIAHEAVEYATKRASQAAASPRGDA